jgi:hypothetical protein
MSAIKRLIVVGVAITMAIKIGKEAVISFGIAISNTLELSNSVENSTSFASATLITSSKRQESFLPFDGSRQTQQISEKKRATQLFEVNNWFYFTANMTFGALLYWKASFLFLRDINPGKGLKLQLKSPSLSCEQVAITTMKEYSSLNEEIHMTI